MDVGIRVEVRAFNEGTDNVQDIFFLNVHLNRNHTFERGMQGYCLRMREKSVGVSV